MQNTSLTLPVRVFFTSFWVCVFLTCATPVHAWGSDGHTAIGILAVDQLNPHARRELESIIRPLDDDTLKEACNMSDVIRSADPDDISARNHYVNIPRGESRYSRSRDCPDQYCATEAIKDYAGKLADRRASNEERNLAFAWLCHLTGDLHQPLHAGFADDRGGNNVEVIYNGEPMNLHGLWDFAIINQHAHSHQELIRQLKPTQKPGTKDNWLPEMVNSWTNDSHELARKFAYSDPVSIPDPMNLPAPVGIDENYERMAWKLIQDQVGTAASRLAMIMNSSLGKMEPEN